MKSRVYVGNLPYEATEEEIRAAFSPFGEVSEIKIVSDRETGRPRGFAFVEMDERGAALAIAGLDQTDFGGRTLTVNVAKERERRGGGGRDRAEQRDTRGRHGW